MLRYITRTETKCSSSDSSSDDDDYKCIIPKCNNKFSVGNKKKVWKKIYTNNMIINGFNLFVRTINNIIIIGFNRPDDTTFFPIGTVAYWSGTFVYNSTTPNTTIASGAYVPFTLTSGYNITMVPTTTTIPGSLFSIKFPGYYQITFGIQTDAQQAGCYFSIYVQYAPASPNIYDYHTDYGTTMLFGTAILKLAANDVIGIINNPTPALPINITGIGTNISITYVGPISGI